MSTTIAQKITPFLWFNDNAMEAAEFYVSIFKDSRILQTARRPKSVPGEVGGVLTVDFELDGQRFTAMNGGPNVTFDEAVSLVVHCETQAEIDDVWAKLTSGGGEAVQCGWLKDRFGLRWQVWPAGMEDWMRDPEKFERVLGAVMKMVKLDKAELERVARG